MKKGIYLMILLMCLCNIKIFSYGAERNANWQMWHGNQDALILGTISQIDNESITLKVDKKLYPKGIINETYRQISDEKIDDVLMIEKFEKYETSYNNKGTTEVGDVIVVSLDIDDGIWKVNWAPFEVSCNDYKVLEFLPPDRETPESFAWTTFIKTDGKMNDFAFINKKNQSKVIGKGIFDDGKIVEDEIYTVTSDSPFTINAYFEIKNISKISIGVVMIIMGGLLYHNKKIRHR